MYFGISWWSRRWGWWRRRCGCWWILEEQEVNNFGGGGWWWRRLFGGMWWWIQEWVARSQRQPWNTCSINGERKGICVVGINGGAGYSLSENERAEVEEREEFFNLILKVLFFNYFILWDPYSTITLRPKHTCVASLNRLPFWASPLANLFEGLLCEKKVK